MTRDEGVALRMTGDEGVGFGMTKDEGAAFRTIGKGRWVRNDRMELPYFCHFMLGEEAGIGNWRVRDDFRFFTPLRSVQNDKG